MDDTHFLITCNYRTLQHFTIKKKNFKHYSIYLYHYLSGISKGQKAVDCKTCCFFTWQRNLSSQSCEFTEDYLHYTYVLVGPKSLYADVTKSMIKLHIYLFLLIS